MQEMIRSWFVEEIELQKRKLGALKKASHFKDITGYWELVSLREKAIKLSERELQKLDKKQNEKT